MSGRLRVLHVETGRHLYGGALQVAYLLEGLQGEGCSNILVCPQGSGIAQAAARFVERLYEPPFAGDADVVFALRLTRIIRREQPDLIHLHSRRGADLWGALAARRTRTPCLLTRRVDNPEPRWWAARKYRLYDKVVTISEGIRQVLLAEGVPGERVVCVHSAVDTRRFRPNGSREWLLRELDLEAGARLVGVVAQLIPRKGHRFLIEALPHILQRVPEARFAFFGQGPLEAELRAHCARLGLADRVRFAGFRDDLHRVLPCLDLLVHPATLEGLGVSLLQASACAVPIVAAAAGGIPEAVRDGENGVLVPPGDVQALGERVTAVLAEPALAARMGQAGRALVEREFSIAAMVAGNLRAYQSVLQRRKPQTAAGTARRAGRG